MFEFKHPKYYKNLRAAARAAPLSIRPPARNTDQAISARETADDARATGPGLKQQASSTKPQASSTKLIKK